MTDPANPVLQRETWRTALAVVLFCILAFGLRVYVRYGSPNHLFYGNAASGQPASDAVTWYLHSTHLVEGRGLGDNIRQFPSRNFVPPGHPAVLASIRLFTGPDPRRIGWVVALLGSLLPWLGFLWGREMWGPRIGLWVAFLAAIHPPFTHVGFSMMSEPSAVVSMAAALFFGARALRQARMRSALAAGLAYGLAGLVRPAVLAFLWTAAGAVLFRPGLPVRRRIALFAVWLAAAGLPFGLWQVRNHRVHGEWANVYSSISARHVWTGANPEYRPTFYSRTAWHETMWREPYATEISSIRRMQAEAAEWIRAEPLRYAAACVWRLSHLFPEFRQGHMRISFSQGGWSRFFFAVLFCFAWAGTVLGYRTRTSTEEDGRREEIPGKIWTLSLLAGIFLSLVGVGIYGAAPRYRWPLEVAWLPFAALFLDGLAHAASRPLYAAQIFVFSSVRPSPRARAWRRAAGIGAVGLAGACAVGLGVRHRFPAAPELHAPAVSRETVEARVDALGLADEWARQTPAWISYADVFAEQARNYGAVTTLNHTLVAWWGVLRMPIFDEAGLKRGYLILDPSPGDIGGARLDLLRHPDAQAFPGEWKDGQVVFCIARLRYRKRSVGRPELLAYAVYPGRIEDAAGSPVHPPSTQTP